MKYTIKSKNKNFAVCILAAGMLLICTCSGSMGDDTATIKISLGTVTGKAAGGISVSELKHIITFSGPTGIKTLTITGGGSASVSVAPGHWQISVEAYFGDELYAVGTASVDVKTGRNTSVMVQMTVVWGGAGNDGSSVTTTAPSITTASLPGGLLGAAYSQTLTATGKAPITWNIDSGLLPDGLTLDTATGVISGTPTVANTFAFAVKASNSVGNDTKTFSVVIIPTYTVTFEDYYDINEDLEVQVSQGDTITKPTNPTKTAEAGLYSGALSALPTISFGDWYDGITLFNFTTPINSDISLTATWSPSSPLIDLSTTLGATIVDKAVTYANANSGAYTLFLDGDVSVAGGGLTLNGKLSLIGLTSAQTISQSSMGNMFVISGTGSALTLGQNITLQGTGNNTALVQVSSDGTLTMETGARITGNTNSSGGNGGGVEVTSTGTFNMNGGIISGNYANATGGSGAGVYVNGPGASFNMQGSAEVSGNKAYASGGGVYVDGGGFTMSDSAKVSANNNTQIPSKGGGVHILNGNFIMSDSASVSNQILNNLGDGAGVYLETSTLIMNDYSTVSGNAGSNGNGVYAIAGSTFAMFDSASVSGNSETGNGGGGGVCVDGSGSIFTMWGNASVSNNTAQDGGGGVYVDNNAAFIMESGTVSGNTVNNGNGGGVMIANNGTFTMKSGTISGNTLTNTSGNGGGVAVYFGCTFAMSGGVISGNTSNLNGGGVFLAGSGIFQISNGTVYGSNASAPFANSAATTGVALFASAGTTAEYGPTGTGTSFGTVPFARENTIEVIARVLQ